jgi:hypothetical protein
MNDDDFKTAIPPQIGRVDARSFCECQPPVNARMWLMSDSLEKELDFGVRPLLFPPPHDVIISVWPEPAPYEGKSPRVTVIVHGCPEHGSQLALSLQQAVRLAELLREAADEANGP